MNDYGDWSKQVYRFNYLNNKWVFWSSITNKEYYDKYNKCMSTREHSKRDMTGWVEYHLRGFR